MLTLTIWSQAEGLDWSSQRLVPRWHWTNLGRGNTLLGWLSGFWAQTGPVADCDFFRCLGEAAAPGWGECGPCPDFSSYTLAFVLQLRKITENLSQVSRKAHGWSEHDSFSRLGHRQRWPRMFCCPLPPLAFASGDGVNLLSAWVSAELPY